MLPPYDCGEGVTEEEALRQAARRGGLQARMQARAALPEAEPRRHQDREYLERLEYRARGHLQDGLRRLLPDRRRFHRLGEEHGIPVGPGRGSGAGSLVA